MYREIKRANEVRGIGGAFDNVVNYSNSLRETVGMTFPKDSLIGHLEFHKVLVRFVAGVLVAAGEHPGVNDTLSAIAFNDNGIQRDERLPIVEWHNRIERQAQGHLTFGGHKAQILLHCGPGHPACNSSVG